MPDTRNRVPAIILGSGITVLGVQRLLGRGGITAYLATPEDPLNRRTRWFRAMPGSAAPPTPDGLADWLDATAVPGAVLFPCSDAWALAVASLGPGARARFPSSIAGRDTIEALTDKGRFEGALRELAIPHPWSAAVETVKDIEALPSSVFQRLFLKPRESQSFHADFGCKGFMTRSPEEARDRLRSVTGRGHAVIAQEYIPGPPTSHYFVDGFIARDGRVRGIFVRRRLRMHPPLFGNSTYMRSVQRSEAGEAVDSVQTLLAALGYRGVFSAEFKRDDRDGVFKILEVNARPWWYVEFAARAGVDVCAMAYRDALGQDTPDIAEYEVGRELVYPYSDWLACRRLLRRGELTLPGWAGSWVGSDQPVFQLWDPWPAVVGAAEILGGWMMNRIRALRPSFGGTS